MRRTTIELILEATSVCVAAAVLVIALNASLGAGDDDGLDVSEGRGAVLLVSIVFVLAGLFLFRRSWRSIAGEANAEGTESDIEPSTEVAHGEPEREVVLKTPMTEDESRLYEMISEAGGEMLQMHIVSSEVFSKAKVTRLLDKLEKRGLVVRERHGMTNRVRIIR